MFTNSLKKLTNKTSTFETISFKNPLSGNWKCIFKITKITGSILLGVSNKKIELIDLKRNDFLGKLQYEYALNLHTGFFWKNDKKLNLIEMVFKSGDLIEMALEKGSLSFKKGSNKMFGFKGIGESVYPAVSIMKKDDCVEIVSVDYI